MKKVALFTCTAWVVLQMLTGAQQAAPQRTLMPATDGKLNVIAFGAHPDDCDQRARAAPPPSSPRSGTMCASSR